MAKKDFSQVDTNPLYNSILEASNEEIEAEKIEAETMEDAKLPKNKKKATDEAEELRPELIRRNRPRKGMCRFFTYLTPENMEYINIMSGVSGVTRQVFINELIENERETNDTYRQALELKMQLQKGKK